MKPIEHLYLAGGRGERFFGPGPCELLAGVERLGSLSAAAQAMHMSYSKATRLLRNAEQGVGAPLTERTVGGEGGGGSRLTPLGCELLERYQAWTTSAEQASYELFYTCFAGFAEVPRLGCVVMASGEGRRFGAQKLLAPLAGKPLIAWTIDALPTDLVDVVVVTRDRELAQFCAQRGIACKEHDGSLQSDTIRRGLEAIGQRPACIFVPGDQPLLARHSVRELVLAACLHPNHIVRLAWQGVPKSPTVFPASAFEALRALEGDVGGSELLAHRPDLRQRVMTVEAQSEWELSDVDTQEDLTRLAGIVEHERL